MSPCTVKSSDIVTLAIPQQSQYPISTVLYNKILIWIVNQIAKSREDVEHAVNKANRSDKIVSFNLTDLFQNNIIL